MPFNFTLPEWLWVIIITVVVIGLVKYAWHAQGARIKKIEDILDGLNQEGGILTHGKHSAICKSAIEEREKDMEQSVKQMKEWLGLKLDLIDAKILGIRTEVNAAVKSIDDKIEGKIYKELKKLNGST